MRLNKIDFKNGNCNLPQSKHPSVYNKYSTYLYTDRILAILKQHSRHYSDQPFFLFFSAQSIHAPYQVPKQYQDMYRDSNKKTLSLSKTVSLNLTYIVLLIISILDILVSFKNSVFVTQIRIF